MTLEVLADAEAVAQAGAKFIAARVRESVSQRGRAVIALSGGATPWVAFKALATEDLSWGQLEIFQVDDRVAPDGHTDRNLTHLVASLPAAARIHAMPVNAENPESAARDYQNEIESFAGVPAVLDLIHLGLGPDGHTASLVPNDDALEIQDRDVAMTGVYQGRKRMTLTFPIINRARSILWLVTGATKAAALEWLCDQDATVPAGRVSPANSLVLADRAAKTG